MKNLMPILLVIFICQNSYSQKLSKIKKEIINEVELLKSSIDEVCQTLWDYSEIALREQRSAEYLTGILKKEGFKIEKAVAGMPTAFVASYGSGKPIIGILAEYDALPGVGNAPVPYREARNDGITSGQGCGHNLFGSACINAAIVIKKIMEKHGFSGTLRLYGTPAEETVVGKVYMARAGLFDDLDASLEWHPDTENKVNYESSLAMNNFQVEFFGQAAHGAVDPWNGRSALDAVELMNFGVNLMREHVYPTTRMHYVIPNAGEAPNVVPEYAKVWYYVRDTSRTNVEKYYNRILNIAEGAALATNTTHKVTLITGVHEYNLNYPLMKAIQSNMEIVGPPKFTDEEQSWGKKLQESTQKDQEGFRSVLKKIPDNWEKLPVTGGSTDVAEVSFITPTAGFGIATAPFGVPWHSWATSASHGTKTSFKSAHLATKIRALTAIDLFTNEKLRNEAMNYFISKTGGKPYQSPLPDGQMVILPE